MIDYTLTVYAKDGENLLDETFSAQNDEEAKEMGTNKLNEHGYAEHTHRCVSPDARLILFHR